ncbi:hypothetical protein ACFQX6_31420 [Streptosporangium lutulentum]
MRFSNVLRIERPVGVVFDYLADLRNLPAWNYAIRETRPITPGPAGPGTVYRQLRSLPGPCGNNWRSSSTSATAVS